MIEKEKLHNDAGADGAAIDEVVTVVEPVYDADALAKQEIVKLDANMQRIAEWKEQYSGLVVKSVDDKEGLKAVQEAKRVLRKGRTTVDSRRKDAVSLYVKVQKAVNEQARVYISAIEEIESHIDAEIEKVERWQREEEERKAAEIKAKLDGRVKLLEGIGFSFNGSWYQLGDMSLDIVTIQNLKDADFETLQTKANEVSEKMRAEEARIAEEKRKQQEEEDRKAEELRKEQERVRVEAERLEAQRKEIEETQRQMAQQKLAMRQQMAENAGLTFNSVMMCYRFENKYTNQVITVEEMKTLDDVAFSKKVTDADFAVRTAKNNQEISERKAREEAQRKSERLNQLAEMSVFANGAGKVAYVSHPQIFIESWKLEAEDAGMWATTLSDLRERIISYEKAVAEKKARYESRLQKLADLGFAQAISGADEMAYLDNNFPTVIHTDSLSSVKEMTDEEFATMFERLACEISSYHKAKEEREARKQKVYAELGRIGYAYNGQEMFSVQYEYANPVTVHLLPIHIESDEAAMQFIDDCEKLAKASKAASDEVKAQKEQAKPEVERMREYLLRIREAADTAPEFTNRILSEMAMTTRDSVIYALDNANELVYSNF